MAGEIHFTHAETGVNCYAVVRDRDSRQVWNGTGFTALVVASWADYALPMLEAPSGSYFYQVDFPRGVTDEGDYPVDIYRRAGVAPAVSDQLVSSGGLVVWEGSSARALSALFNQAAVAVTVRDGVSSPSVGAV